MEEENYEDFVWVADIEDDILKEKLLREGFKKVPLRSIMPYFGDNDIIAYRIDEKKLPEKMKRIMLERIAEKNSITVEEAEQMLNKNGWFIRANGAGTKNIYKYIG
jgi:hypothetical protein